MTGLKLRNKPLKKVGLSVAPFINIVSVKNSSHKRHLTTFARKAIFVTTVLKLNRKILYVSAHLFLAEIIIIPIIIFFLP